MSVDQVLGVYKATVKRNDDPRQGQRLILLVPQILGTADSEWAEPSDPTSIVPSVGDVVWVQFSGGDIAKPLYIANGLRQLSADVQAVITDITAGTIKDTTVPKQPTTIASTTTLVYTTEGVGSIDLGLTWVAPTENVGGTALTDLQGYIVTWSYEGTQWSGGSYVKTTSWTVRNLKPATTVQIRVLAFDTGGNASAYATASATLPTNPGAPVGSVLGTQATAITAAQATANGKNQVTYSTVAPGTAANAAGDIWFVRSGSVITAQYEGMGGTTWASRTMSNLTIASIDAGSITTGTLAAARVSGDAMDYKTITGGTINSGTINSTTINSASIYSAYLSSASINAGTIDAASITGSSFTTSNRGSNIELGAVGGYYGDQIRLWNSYYVASIRNPDSAPGALRFSLGSGLVTDFIDLGDSIFTIRTSGGQAVSVPGPLKAGGLITSDGIFNNTSTFTANVGIASSPQGRLYRLTSSERYKVEIQPENVLEEAVMALQPKSYVDRGQWEAAGQDVTGLPRYLGLIAEDVAAIPGLSDLLVTYNDDHTPEAVSYDRVAVALISLVQSLTRRVAELESKVSAL